MGYTHSTRWTKEKIIDSIEEARHALMLDRMPSRTEVERYFGDARLTNKISKTGGFTYYADLLGLNEKECETLTGKRAENLIREILISKGYDAESTTAKHPYDLLVNKSVKVDVKAGRIVKSAISPYYTFNLEKKHPTCDVYVAITLDAEDDIQKIFIIPASIMAGKNQLSIGVNGSIYNKYIDRWDLIEKLNEGFENVERLANSDA